MQASWRNGRKKVLMIGNKTWTKSGKEKLNNLNSTLPKLKNITKLLKINLMMLIKKFMMESRSLKQT